MSRVLIVEDSPTQAQSLALTLAMEGYDVEIASDGADGLRQFRSSEFDLVLSDIILPGLSGYALCRAIKSDPKRSATPVILISELGDPSEVNHALECGAQQFIAKPYDEAHLTSSIKAAISTREARQSPTNVLVVEDSPTQAVELAFILEERGFTVRMAPDAESAYDLVDKHHFDLILTDLHLPGDSGFDLCRRLKQNEHLRSTRIVVLTAKDDPANVLRGLEVGADDFMTKGREPEAIVARLRRVLEQPARSGGLDSHPIPVDFLSESFTVRAGRDQVLQFLVSAFEDVVDLTLQLKRRTGELSAANTRLEHEVKERQRAEQEALEASQTKSQFLANMSHELRTPLNAIIGYSELIQEDAEDSDVPQIGNDATKILSAARHLMALVSDILDISKIEAGKTDLYLEAIHVPTMVEELASSVMPLVQKNNNQLVLNCAPSIGSIVADSTKLRQALLNLLSNASKFTKDGMIRLEVRRHTEGKSDTFTFAVTDTGIGIPNDRLETLFDAFTQADSSTTKKYGGTGLGLAISREFCRMMQGDIEAESEVGVGSTFSFWLPARVKPGQPVVSKPTQRTERVEKSDEVEAPLVEPVNGSVLIIDDDPAVHELFRRYLEDEPVRIQSALTALDGLKLARTLRPSIILLDVVLSDMEGWDLLTVLKSDPLFETTPVVLISIIADRERGFALGASEYLVKPVDRERLLTVLRKTLPANDPSTVLVVEDDPETREILRRNIERPGRRVVATTNGREALDYLEHHRPQLTLVDLMMPIMDGFELIERVRSNSCFDAMPIVVLTAMPLNEIDRGLLHDRVSEVITKDSCAIDRLMAHVRETIRNTNDSNDTTDNATQPYESTTQSTNT